MAGFRRSGDGVTARFARPEAAIIRDLVEQVVELIEPDAATGRTDGSAADNGAADNGARDNGAADNGAADNGAADNGAADNGAADNGAADNGAAEIGADELAAMVGMSDGDGELPDDPVLARLLPDAYRDDPDAASEFRRFTESGLRSAKVECAQILLDTLPAGGGRVRLSPDQAESWLRTLNDVRLALGVRLGVTDDFDALDEDVQPEDPRFAYVQVYQWLAYIQGSLVAALS